MQLSKTNAQTNAVTKAKAEGPTANPGPGRDQTIAEEIKIENGVRQQKTEDFSNKRQERYTKELQCMWITCVNEIYSKITCDSF